MDFVAGHIARIREIEKIAQERPCALDDLTALGGELETCILTLRQEREQRRKTDAIESEPAELRKAMESARVAIRRALAEHQTEQSKVERLEEMVRRGHLHEAATARAKCTVGERFADLDLEFVAAAVVRHQRRQQWLFVSALMLTAVVLLAVTIIELMRRSTSG